MKNWSTDMFSVFLYNFYPKRPTKNPIQVVDILEDYYEPNFPPNPTGSEIVLNILPFAAPISNEKKQNKNWKKITCCKGILCMAPEEVHEEVYKIVKNKNFMFFFLRLWYNLKDKEVQYEKEKDEFCILYFIINSSSIIRIFSIQLLKFKG